MFKFKIYNFKLYNYLSILCICSFFTACSIPSLVNRNSTLGKTPNNYTNQTDTTNSAIVNWKQYFNDQNLIALIDTALKNNQELNITLQEIQIASNEVRARKGEYLPFLDIAAGAGVEKPSRFTSRGASDAITEIEEGRKTPDPLQDYMIGVYASWEVDIWKKLRNAKKSAYLNYLSSIEGKNFLVTHLIAEIANEYYELLALDNQLAIINQNIEIQDNALRIVKLQKQSGKVTELAVKRFEAQLLNTKGLKYDILQGITLTENRINFLLGRYPQPIERDSDNFMNAVPNVVLAGIPSQLLANRPDIRQAELKLQAAKLDVNVARANFYPSLRLTAGIGLRAFNPAFLVKTPESILYSLAGDLAAPLINRNAIKATYLTANAKQIQAIYDYERTILNSYLEVTNQLSYINNLEQKYNLEVEQVEKLNQATAISNDLFQSTRADYMEILLTQRDVLEARVELIETKNQQMHATVNVYRALGGGWR
ncbi:TolC family protein [Bernardetia sp.]|uniref:TolC family protein n=1 Tax=Bernardetia sp. TaxID=1937974 RepID=UPI0025C3B4F8|nr:TolC family protein [Bernardetia sp.]